MANWLQLNDDDFTVGVNDVKSEIISSNSTAESAKAGAQNLKVTLENMKKKLAELLRGERIENITTEQTESLIAKAPTIAFLVDACDVFMAACNEYKTGMQT